MDAAASLEEQRRLAFSTLTKHASKVARGTRGTREEQEDDIELSGDEEEPTEPGPPRRMSPSEIATALAIDAALVKVLQSDGDILNRTKQYVRDAGSRDGAPSASSRALSAPPTAAVLRRDKWGRWLPEDRYSLDQVPCTLGEGDARTYNKKGADEHAPPAPRACTCTCITWTRRSRTPNRASSRRARRAIGLSRSTAAR